MKKVFLSAQLEVVYFEAVDIITTSDYTTGSSTPAASSSETPFVPGDGFHGEELPF